MVIDLNCDLGEGMPTDEAMMPFISSANIACGYHAGNTETMQQTILLCLQHQVAIGAHPSFLDRANFGRTAMNISPLAIEQLVIDQLTAIQLQCNRLGAVLRHVKPHGALYNMSASDESVAMSIAKAVYQFNPGLLLFGLAGSLSVRVAESVGLKAVHEFFADRTYQPDGSLTPRSQPQALITQVQQATQQAWLIAERRMVPTTNGTLISLGAEASNLSICLHGDGPFAVDFGRAIHALFVSKNVIIKPVM
jgi:5-oxoprolinase (ATP-hydrolysing) subunit A